MNLFGRPKGYRGGLDEAIRRRVRGGEPETADGEPVPVAPASAAQPTPSPTQPVSTDAIPPIELARGRLIAPDAGHQDTSTVILDPGPIPHSVPPLAVDPVTAPLLGPDPDRHATTPPQAPTEPPPLGAAEAQPPRSASSDPDLTRQTPPAVVRPSLAPPTPVVVGPSVAPAPPGPTSGALWSAVAALLDASRQLVTVLATGLATFFRRLSTVRPKLPPRGLPAGERAAINLPLADDTDQGPGPPDPVGRYKANWGARLAAIARTLSAWSPRRGVPFVARVALAAAITLGVAAAVPRLRPAVDVAAVAQFFGIDDIGPIGGIFGVLGGEPGDPSGPTGVRSGDGVLAQLLLRLGIREMGPGALPAVSRAYRAQFGHGLDDDLPDHFDEIEEWLIGWKAAYESGEAWAKGMARP